MENKRFDLNEILEKTAHSLEAFRMPARFEAGGSYAGFRERVRCAARELMCAMFPEHIGDPDSCNEFGDSVKALLPCANCMKMPGEAPSCSGCASAQVPAAQNRSAQNCPGSALSCGGCGGNNTCGTDPCGTDPCGTSPCGTDICGENSGISPREALRRCHLNRGANKLKEALMYVAADELGAMEMTAQLISRIPDIQKVLATDIVAAYQGDPAAKGVEEIMLSYPGFTAVGMYRIAHELYLMNIPLVPRMMTEYAHELTGIDIHPGATIGEYFFIDHGTGVVIGETTVIGDHVKLYQNVTLGARSFPVAEDGSLIKGIRRHPTLGSGVVVYAGATILGGDTVIGDNCVIGGNVWLTRSVAPGRTVLTKAEEK